MTPVLAELLGRQVFVWLLVFARIGTAMVNIPALGEQFVPTQTRLVLALIITVLVAPMVEARIPPEPGAPALVFLLIGGEMLIGLFIGTAARLLMSALDVAGMIIATMAGLSNAAVFNPMLASQGSLPGAFLGWIGIGLIFVTDLHHMLISGMVESYTWFAPGAVPPVEEFANMVTFLVSKSFKIGVEMAAPFLVTGLLLALALGLLNKLAPQVHVFFVFTSLQVMFGLFLFGLTLAAMMTAWLQHFHGMLVEFLIPG
jgi:flagellar biosynthetic protein FliR